MFSEIFIKLIEKHRKSVYAISKSTGISESLLSRYKSGQIKPSAKNLEIIANYFKVSIDYLITGEDLQDSLISIYEAAEGVSVPIYGSVKAGCEGIAIDELLGYELFDKSSLNANKLEDYFCFIIKGDSMSPQLIENDVVLVRRQEDADSGKVAVVALNSEESAVKKIKKGKDYIELIPYNPAHESLVIEGEKLNEMCIAGVVVELKRRFR